MGKSVLSCMLLSVDLDCWMHLLLQIPVPVDSCSSHSCFHSLQKGCSGLGFSTGNKYPLEMLWLQLILFLGWLLRTYRLLFVTSRALFLVHLIITAPCNLGFEPVCSSYDLDCQEDVEPFSFFQLDEEVAFQQGK